MSKPDDIPQDVWESARAAIAGQRADESLSEAVARAILSERERCAKVAEAMKWDVDAPQAIATAIRKGTP